MPESSANGGVQFMRLNLPPWGAVTMSGFVTGLGQMLTGRVLAGLLWLVALEAGGTIVLWLAISSRIASLIPFLAGFAVLTAAWLAMLVHAYRGVPRAVDPHANRPWIAVILSAIIPGAGQLYNRAFVRFGIVLFALIAAGLLVKRIGTVGFHLIAVLAILDAYRFHGQRGRPLAVVAAVVVGAQMLFLADKALLVEPFKVPTSTMVPTLHGIEQRPDGRMSTGDHILVDKLTYRLREPYRGEIVVFRTSELRKRGFDPRGEFYVKRIVGLPGETVSICPPYVCIDGKPISDPPIFREIGAAKDGYTGYVIPSGFTRPFLQDQSSAVQLGADEYFVLGDNSRSSLDSRYWGPISRKAIIGRVTKIYWPLDRAGAVR